LAASFIGVSVWTGLLLAATAMAGDLLASFLKRRLHFASSSRAVGLDQIPESLFPLLAAQYVLPLSAVDTAVGCIIFYIGDVLLSRWLFKLRLREQPY
jgi:CDP-2,3-bis-(O-geranylgeranyl)-sn-glycerol synthase